VVDQLVPRPGRRGRQAPRGLRPGGSLRPALRASRAPGFRRALRPNAAPNANPALDRTRHEAPRHASYPV